MSKSFTLLVVMVVAAPSMALAGPYVGVGGGGARMESSLAELGLVPNLTTDTDVIGTDPDFSSTDVSCDVTAGWMFGEHFGVEVGYVFSRDFEFKSDLPTIRLADTWMLRGTGVPGATPESSGT